MKALVTGANGLVGSRLCRILQTAGHDVVGIGRGPHRAQDTKWAYRTCELTDRAAVELIAKEHAPELIIHTASMTDVDGCERDVSGAYAANVDAAAYVAQAARTVSAHLVHVSTDYVFDGDHGPYSEEHLPNPRGTYALTKHMGEQAARTFVPTCAIARTAVVYGWPPAGRPNFGSWLVNTLKQGQNVKLFEDQTVSPSLAESVAAMLAELGEKKLPGIWNVSGSEVVDRMTFGRALCEVFGFSTSLLIPTRMADLKLASPRPLKSGLLTTKIAGALRAQPLSLSDSLQRFHAEVLAS